MKQFQPSESLAVGFLLALTGGLLDAYSYLNRGEVFATAETGNIVLMGINLAQQNWSGALHYLLPVLAFTAGILAAEWVRRRCDPGEGRPQRLHWRLPLLLAECVAILVVSALPMGPLDPLANTLSSPLPAPSRWSPSATSRGTAASPPCVPEICAAGRKTCSTGCPAGSPRRPPRSGSTTA